MNYNKLANAALKVSELTNAALFILVYSTISVAFIQTKWLRTAKFMLISQELWPNSLISMYFTTSGAFGVWIDVDCMWKFNYINIMLIDKISTETSYNAFLCIKKSLWPVLRFRKLWTLARVQPSLEELSKTLLFESYTQTSLQWTHVFLKVQTSAIHYFEIFKNKN